MLKAPTKKQLDRAGIRIVVGIPMERVIGDMPFFQFWNIAANGYELIPIVYGRTDANRNRMADWLLNSKYTHLCMLDSDHIHASDIVEHLARWVLQDRRKLFIGGVNYRRTVPYDPCIYRVDEDRHLKVIDQWDEGLIPVDGMGTGCVLISREVFERVPRPWFAYTYDFAEQNEYPAEDLYFSGKCRNYGIDIWCDTGITSPHIGQMFIDDRMYRGFKLQHAAPSANGNQAPVLEMTR